MVERRTAQRFRLPVEVEVRQEFMATKSEFIHAKTLDVSSGGLYIKSNQRLAVGTQIALSLTLPTNGMGAIVDCKARVVRVEENPNVMAGHFGIAFVIDSYNFVRPKSVP
jgi:c-di-GMP-binding flagellar brake protein YcgR